MTQLSDRTIAKYNEGKHNWEIYKAIGSGEESIYMRKKNARYNNEGVKIHDFLFNPEYKAFETWFDEKIVCGNCPERDIYCLDDKNCSTEAQYHKQQAVISEDAVAYVEEQLNDN